MRHIERCKCASCTIACADNSWIGPIYTRSKVYRGIPANFSCFIVECLIFSACLQYRQYFTIFHLHLPLISKEYKNTVETDLSDLPAAVMSTYRTKAYWQPRLLLRQYFMTKHNKHFCLSVVQVVLAKCLSTHPYKKMSVKL